MVFGKCINQQKEPIPEKADVIEAPAPTIIIEKPKAFEQLGLKETELKIWRTY